MLRRIAQIAAVAAFLALACSSENDGGYGTSGGVGGSISIGSSGVAGSAQSGTSGGGALPGEGALGETCDAEHSCTGDLVCSRADKNDPVFGGGPAHGYCTKPCASHADCPGGLCAKNNMGDQECLRACTIGAPPFMSVWDKLDPGKCLGRPDLSCVELDGGQGVCAPTCGADSDCPVVQGVPRKCDPWLAVCVDTANVGAKTGEKCDPMPTTHECAGVCLQFGQNQTMCSSPCTLGGETVPPKLPTLPTTTDCGGLSAGLCFFKPQKNGLGDEGFCAPSCNVHADCQTPLLWCFSFPGPDKQPLPNGYCFTAQECPGGNSDCIGPDLTCVATADGPYCLEMARFGPTSGAGGAGGGI